MARFPSNNLGRQTQQGIKWFYIIPTLVLAVGIVAVLYFFNPFKSRQKGEPQLPVTAATDNSMQQVEPKTPENPVVVSEQTKPLQAAPQLVSAEPNLPKVSQPAAVSGSDPKALKLIAEATNCLKEEPAKIIEARNRLNDALALPMTKEDLKLVKDQLTKLADEWLFSRKIFPEDKLCSSYKVRQGDLLLTIAQQHNIPYEILMEIDKIPKPQSLQAGATIKVINGPFHAKIYRSTFTLDLYLQNVFVKSFRIGLGKPGFATPTGLWIVKPGGKFVKPTWTDPDTGRTYLPDDPDYPLGSRWIGLEGISGDAKGRPGFAIHGTQKPDEIGAATSRGCIRMYNGDAVLMYNLLVPTSSQVVVAD